MSASDLPQTYSPDRFQGSPARNEQSGKVPPVCHWRPQPRGRVHNLDLSVPDGTTLQTSRSSYYISLWGAPWCNHVQYRFRVLRIRQVLCLCESNSVNRGRYSSSLPLRWWNLSRDGAHQTNSTDLHGIRCRRRGRWYSFPYYLATIYWKCSEPAQQGNRSARPMLVELYLQYISSSYYLLP